MDYMKRSKKTEASLQLNKIGKNAKRVYSETGSYVATKTTAPLPTPVSGGSCCGGVNNHCAAAPSDFIKDPTWTALDFQIDEPTLFTYTYDGTTAGTFTAMAVGDLDCDTTLITYTMVGTSLNGNPAVTITEPPVNAD